MSDDKKAAQFWAWFDEMRGSWSIRQVERQAQVPRNRISSVYTSKKQPTLLTCAAIAAGLNIPIEEVLQHSGNEFNVTSVIEPFVGSGTVLSMFGSSGIIPVPSLQEQKEIASAVEEKLKAIENKEEVDFRRIFQQLNSQNRKTIVDHMKWLLHNQQKELETTAKRKKRK